ncbi:glutamate--tRNA ligase, partial [Candidatus Aerophobetes bacterium]|nr:glutamate--tRNA ligase [Candidatus Aerophobetes bacterium]
MMQIRVRFAPSPTGELHIGGVRTALFNWLFARHHGGRFILRIENTDIARSQEDFTKSIIENLKWLGLNWDEGPEVGGEYGPYFQLERLPIYREMAEKLLKEKRAYLCFCTPEELEAKKKKMREAGIAPVYDGRCRNLSPQEKRKFEEEGRKPAIRFRVEKKGQVEVKDLLRGNVRFDCRILGDFIILKSDGTPTFNFANVVDDALMRITHVIRGDDHLSNTPRQLLLYEALGFKPPVYAHLPMILGKDGSKLSKRHGATSITYYREKGYLPWALINYLALLGWSTVDSQQFFTKEELIEKFSLERVNRSPAIFDPQKLEWMNAEYIRKLSTEELARLLIPYLREKGWIGEEIDKVTYQKILSIAELEKDRLRVLSDITQLADFFFEKDFVYDKKAVEKRLKKDYVFPLLKRVKREVEDMQSLSRQSFEKLLRGIAEEENLSTSQVFH